jgi:uncharacterized protein involved in copper resistance
MSGWPELDRLLQTDPRDIGCADAMEVLHVDVDLVASGASAEARHGTPLSACPGNGDAEQHQGSDRHCGSRRPGTWHARLQPDHHAAAERGHSSESFPGRRRVRLSSQDSGPARRCQFTPSLLGRAEPPDRRLRNFNSDGRG